MDIFRRVADSVGFSQEKMTKNNIFETERFFCDLYCFEPGQAQSRHSHEGSDKVYFVLQGRGMFQIGQEEKELGVGEIALAASGQSHGVRNSGTSRLILLVFVAPKPAH